MAYLLFRFIGPVQSLVSVAEPKISDMAVNRHNNNIFHHHQQNSNFILTYSQYTNLAIFIFLFFILAIEVIFVKIVTAINMDENQPSNIDVDLLNNNSIVGHNFNYANRSLYQNSTVGEAIPDRTYPHHRLHPQYYHIHPLSAQTVLTSSANT